MEVDDHNNNKNHEKLPKKKKNQKSDDEIIISVHDFKQYMCSKAYDIISEGKYRKYLVKCKGSSDEWALSVQASVSLVQAKVKKVSETIAALDEITTSCMNLACKEVMSSLSPPSKVREGQSVCCITGISSDKCIDLSSNNMNSIDSREVDYNSFSMGTSMEVHRRFVDNFNRCFQNVDSSESSSVVVNNNNNKNKKTEKKSTTSEPTAWLRNSREFLVHPKLSHFFLMLWYVCKIDHVVRNYTRGWIDNMIQSSSKGDEENSIIISEMCDKFSDQDQVFESMCDMFNHGVSHVIDSVESYINENH